MNFAGKTALVTGGTSGIGKATALALKSAGAAVTVTALPGREAAEAAKAADLEGIRVLPLDVSDQKAVDAIPGQLRPLDALVNCAGTIGRQQEWQIETFLKVLDVNLSGTMRVCLACKPLLAARKGAVVNIGSMYSIFGGPHAPGYTASKGGIMQLTKALAVAWAAEGIRVNAVAPGWIRTQLTQPAQDDPGRSDPIVARTPMRRWGEPTDVAGPILFLLSEPARFVTGVLLPVDGGYSVS